jgi:hypothetical protein
MFLSDLSNRFKEEGLDGILESVCSEFFQGFFKRQVDGKPVDLLSQEWRAWVGGVAVLTSVKGIAAKVRELFGWDWGQGRGLWAESWHVCATM